MKTIQERASELRAMAKAHAEGRGPEVFATVVGEGTVRRPIDGARTRKGTLEGRQSLTGEWAEITSWEVRS